MDILHHYLKAVEASCLWYLDLSTESLNEVLIDDAIRCSEECKNVRDEVSLVVIQAIVPVVQVLGEINLLSCPE